MSKDYGSSVQYRCHFCPKEGKSLSPDGYFVCRDHKATVDHSRCAEACKKSPLHK